MRTAREGCGGVTAPRLRTRVRMLLALFACVALGLLGSVSATATEAAWNDTEAVAATLSARKLPTLQKSLDCTYTSGLIVVYWQMPPGADDLSTNNVVITEDNGVPLGFLGDLLYQQGAVTTLLSAPGESPRRYSTAVNGNLITNLLGTLFGGTITLDLYLTVGVVNSANWNTTAWKSQPLRATAVMGPVLNPYRTCTVSFPVL